MVAVWRDYERHEPLAGAAPPRNRLLAFCLIQHFGTGPRSLFGTEAHASGDPKRDPCLPELGSADYDTIYFVVHTAEVLIGNEPGPWDARLNEYLHGSRVKGLRADGGMNRYWSSPLDVIDCSEELREGLVAKLKAITLGSQTGT